MTTNTNTKTTETTINTTINTNTTNRKENTTMTTKTDIINTINAITDTERKLDACRLINTTNIDHVSIWKDGSVSVLYKSGKWATYKETASDIEREIGVKHIVPKTIKTFISKYEGIEELVRHPQNTDTDTTTTTAEQNPHPIITEAVQMEYEADCRKFGDSDKTPDICGIYGRACCRMGERADRVLCSDCPLRNYAKDAEERPYIVAIEDTTDGIYLRERYSTEETAYDAAENALKLWDAVGIEGRVEIFNEAEGVTIYSANIHATTYTVSIATANTDANVVGRFHTPAEAEECVEREIAFFDDVEIAAVATITDPDGVVILEKRTNTLPFFAVWFDEDGNPAFDGGRGFATKGEAVAYAKETANAKGRGKVVISLGGVGIDEVTPEDPTPTEEERPDRYEVALFDRDGDLLPFLPAPTRATEREAREALVGLVETAPNAIRGWLFDREKCAKVIGSEFGFCFTRTAYEGKTLEAWFETFEDASRIYLHFEYADGADICFNLEEDFTAMKAHIVDIRKDGGEMVVRLDLNPDDDPTAIRAIEVTIGAGLI